MKTVLTALLCFLFLGLISVAEEPAAVKTETVTGEVVSIILKNPSQGSIEIATDEEEILNFSVDSSTKVYDQSMFGVGLGKIQKNSKIKVSYKTDEAGSRIATSINMLK